MKMYVRLLAIVLLLAILLAGLSLSASPTQAQEPRCKGLLKALDNIPPDSPAREKIMEKAQEHCGEALDLAALVDFYHSTGGENWWRSDNWLSEEVHHCDGWYTVFCNADRRVVQIRMLYEDGNNLNGDIPEFLGNLSRLQVLTLFNNQLSSLPESLGNLSSLQVLSLASNPLSSLPESLGNLSSLHSLALNGAQLSSLPESFINLSSLQYLDLRWGNNDICFTHVQADFITTKQGLAYYGPPPYDNLCNPQ